MRSSRKQLAATPSAIDSGKDSLAIGEAAASAPAVEQHPCRTLIFFTVQEDRIGEVRSALQEFLTEPGNTAQVFVVPYSNRFVAIVNQDERAAALERLVQFLTPRFKDLPEFIEMEPVEPRT